MTGSGIRRDVVADRAARVRRMRAGLDALPRASLADFEADERNAAAAESFLRRALEALLDLGRHILAKGFGEAVLEYKQIPLQLERHDILDARGAALLRDMAGYRNRLVHVYDQVGAAELFDIASRHAPDIDVVLAALLAWCDQRLPTTGSGSGPGDEKDGRLDVGAAAAPMDGATDRPTGAARPDTPET